MTRRLEQAVVAMLSAMTDLSAVTIKEGVTDGTIETPFISVVANRDGERVRNSGAYDCTVQIILHTTAGEGPKASSDADLLKYDAAIEEMLFEQSMGDLGDIITANAQDTRVDAVFSPTSEATTFSAVQRNITYQFSCVAMRPSPDAMVVEGAGKAAANAIYPRDGNSGGKPRYTRTGGTTNHDSMLGGLSGWVIFNDESSLYSTAETVATPDLVETWTPDDGITVRRAVAADFN